MSEEIIKRLSARDALNEFYNKHLRQFISACIDLRIWYGFKDMNAIAYPEPIQTINAQGGIQQSTRQVSIAEATERTEYLFHNQQRILRAIKELEKKVDVDNEIDKDLKYKFARIKE